MMKQSFQQRLTLRTVYARILLIVFKKSLALVKTKFLLKLHTCGTAKTNILFTALQISKSIAVTFYTQEKS